MKHGWLYGAAIYGLLELLAAAAARLLRRRAAPALRGKTWRLRVALAR
jgi:hypothetical protein